MTAPQNDLHESLYDVIDLQLQTLSAGAPAAPTDGPAWTQDELAAAVARLQRDKDELVQHWRVEDGVAPAGAPVNARACGKPQPCPHVLELAQRYGLV